MKYPYISQTLRVILPKLQLPTSWLGMSEFCNSVHREFCKELANMRTIGCHVQINSGTETVKFCNYIKQYCS